MKDLEWMDLLVLRTGADEWYQACLRRVKQLEPDYQRILADLPPEEGAKMEAYIAACEELEHALVRLAFRLAKEM